MILFLEDSLAKSNKISEILLTVLVIFILGCMFGYLIEVLFRRFVSAKKWVNPGFMKGPWLPLYGFGIVIMFFLSYLIMELLPDSMIFYNPMGNMFDKNYYSGPTIYDLIPICIMACSLVILEFIAGLLFVKGFKVRLWDYSNMKGNIMGIICPVFSIVWLIAALFFYYCANPFLYDLFKKLFNFMFGYENNKVHFGFIYALGIVYGVFIVDLISSINLFNKISKFAKKTGIEARYEKLKEEQKKQKAEYKEKLISSIPEVLKKTKNLSVPIKQKTKKFYSSIRKLILIDPDKENKNNYDESGRPIKEDHINNQNE